MNAETIELSARCLDLYYYLRLVTILDKDGPGPRNAATLLNPQPLALFADILTPKGKDKVFEAFAAAYARVTAPDIAETNIGTVTEEAEQVAQSDEAVEATQLNAALESLTAIPAAAIGAALSVMPDAAARLTGIARGAEGTVEDILLLSQVGKAAHLSAAFDLDIANFKAVAALADQAIWASPAQFPVTDGEKWGAMPLASLVALSTYAALNKSIFLPVGKSLFAMLAEASPNFGEKIADIANAGGWDAVLLQSAINVMALDTIAKFVGANGVVRAAQYIEAAKHFRTDVAEIARMASSPDGETAQGWLRGHYPLDAAWFLVLKEINDPRREANRDALLAHVLWKHPAFGQ